MVPSHRITDKSQRSVLHNFQELVRIEKRDLARIRLPPPLQITSVVPPILHTVLVLLDVPTGVIRIVRAFPGRNPPPRKHITVLRSFCPQAQLTDRLSGKPRQGERRQWSSEEGRRREGRRWVAQEQSCPAVVDGEQGEAYESQCREKDELGSKLEGASLQKQRLHGTELHGRIAWKRHR